ncbi:aldehyde dehydrogenase family protein [Sporichthya polymorpha]|uniref:aldehyde dehydrogenase family protein n=1 Tax=Sporichthya polymorpha TaxID=35751 RepID=UPI0003A48618|nr:aldehyde dehydrogenase family protein [Sporichthya polymorpha]
MSETTFDPAALRHLNEFFVGGSWIPAATDERAAVVNPSNEDVLAYVAEPSTRDVDLAVEAARRAFDDGPWPTMTVAARIAHVRRFTEALMKRSAEIGDAWGLECGPTAPFRDAINNLVAPTVYSDAFALAESLPEFERRDGFAGPVEIHREPYGVAVSILTYNGPMSYVGMKVLPALLTGNVVIVKLPVETRLTGQLFAEAAEEADLPPGVLSLLAADREASSYLVSHPGVDVVSFTGGTEVGSKVLHGTADRIVKTMLELGGKSAGIVAPDVSTEDLLPMVLPGLLPFQGQVCVALTRLLVPTARRDEIAGALAQVFGSLKIGDAMDPGTEFGPVAVARTRDRCEKFVAEAVAEGATVVAGGKRPAHLDRGWYYEPTLLVDVDNGMQIAQEEVFGPVFTVLTYDDMDDAVKIANDSPYGLTGAIFTHDAELARNVGRRVRAGSFTRNSTGGVLGQPFGGYKRSGLGREMGLEGYLEWTQTKVMKIDTTANYLA